MAVPLERAVHGPHADGSKHGAMRDMHPRSTARSGSERRCDRRADYLNNLATCVSNYPDEKDECIEIYERCACAVVK